MNIHEEINRIFAAVNKPPSAEDHLRTILAAYSRAERDEMAMIPSYLMAAIVAAREEN